MFWHGDLVVLHKVLHDGITRKLKRCLHKSFKLFFTAAGSFIAKQVSGILSPNSIILLIYTSYKYYYVCNTGVPFLNADED